MLILRTQVPCVNVGGCGHRSAVREGLVGLQLDGVGLGVFGLDRLGGLVVYGAVGCVVNQTGEQQVNNPTATDLVRVGGDKWVLGFG